RDGQGFSAGELRVPYDIREDRDILDDVENPAELVARPTRLHRIRVCFDPDAGVRLERSPGSRRDERGRHGGPPATLEIALVAAREAEHQTGCEARSEEFAEPVLGSQEYVAHAERAALRDSRCSGPGVDGAEIERREEQGQQQVDVEVVGEPVGPAEREDMARQVKAIRPEMYTFKRQRVLEV